jgi:hypothetical protein
MGALRLTFIPTSEQDVMDRIKANKKQFWYFIKAN